MQINYIQVIIRFECHIQTCRKDALDGTAHYKLSQETSVTASNKTSIHLQSCIYHTCIHTKFFCSALFVSISSHSCCLCFHHRLVSHFISSVGQESLSLYLSPFPFSSQCLSHSYLPSFHGVCELCSVSHNVTFIHAQKRSLSLSSGLRQLTMH